MSTKNRHMSRWNKIIVVDDNENTVESFPLKSDGSLSTKFAKQSPRNIALFYNKILTESKPSNEVPFASISSLLNPVPLTNIPLKNHYLNKIPPISSIFEKMSANNSLHKNCQDDAINVAQFDNQLLDISDFIHLNNDQMIII